MRRTVPPSAEIEEQIDRLLDQEVTVFSARRIHRPAIMSVFACALLASAISGPTAAQAQQDLRDPDARAVANALAQERYYSSYGEPKPLSPPHAPAPSDDTPWLPIALSITAALTIAAASATRLRRLRIPRRRAARGTA